MSFTMEESLESDWVAVRPNLFEEKEKHKFVFIVAWNEIEGKFAITCHNRTVQRQRTVARDPGINSSDIAGVGGKQESLQSPVKGKLEYTSPFRKSEVRSETVGDSRGKSPGRRDPSSRGLVKGELGIRSSSPAKTPTSSPVKKQVDGKGSCSEQRELNINSHAEGDGGLLGLTKEDSGSRAYDSDITEFQDLESRDECSWAGLFSFQDLRAIHQQLCSVNSEMEPCLPVFPEEPSAMWSVLFGAPEMTEEEVDALCYGLQVYLGQALDTCGWKILSQVLFSEQDDPEEYYESLSELRQKGYEEVLQRARKRLQELLEKHRNTDSMVELLDLYQEEDDAYSILVEATTELYQYLLQPFRDMRELAMLRRQQIKISIENDYLGPRRVESLNEEDEDWQRKAHMAVLSIQDLTVKYFEVTAKAQKAVYERMRADQKKFGKAAWATAVERMEKLQYAVSKETLQLMRAKEICLEQRKHALKQEMQGLQGGAEAVILLDQLERDYYDLQLQLYEVKFEILKCEELLLTAQLESIKRQMAEKQDDVVYYDTYESLEAMLEKEVMTTSVTSQKEELKRLQQTVRQLEAKRGRISAKKAYLRNKKEICIAKNNEKIQQQQRNEEDYRLHHAVQLKREQLKEEEEKKSRWVTQERQKTLDRLRTFKQRYSGQVVLKSTRLRLPLGRRRSAATTPAGDQPHSLQMTMQMLDATDEVSAQEYLLKHGSQERRGVVQGECVSLPPQVIPLDFSQTAFVPHLSCKEPIPEEGSSSGPHSLLLPVPPPPPPPPLLLLPPPPPPPPPPTPLTGEDLEIALQKAESPMKQQRPEDIGVLKPTGMPSQQFFDSGQLVSARRNLRKTSAVESSQKKRVTSPMDEVLASLKRGSFHLRKVEQRALRPFPDEDDSNSILAQIRKGVKLKKVQKETLRDSFADMPDADPLTRSIHEALKRIKEASPESDDDDDSLPSTDWDN